MRQEDGQGDEAGEVEEDVGNLKGENGPWVGDCGGRQLGTLIWGPTVLTLGHELGYSLQVCNGDQGEERYEDQEVDLRRRRGQGVNIVPVGDCCVPLVR